jgi:hypothetical protein
MNAAEWKNQASLLREAAIKASEQMDRDALFTLAEDCESRVASLERGKATASQRRLAQARPGIEHQDRIRQWRMKAEELRTAADCIDGSHVPRWHAKCGRNLRHNGR